jgi:hypothetical protein
MGREGVRMTMRIRQVKPAFFKDARIAELSPSVRLFYIGLWMLADDAGWLWWDVAEVGNELYGYEPRKPRERRAQQYLDTLVTSRRVLLHPCGHVEIPSFTDHQRLAGSTKQVRTTLKDHASRCSPQPPADTRGSPLSPDTVRNGIGKERERLGSVSKGSADSEFQEKVPRLMALGEG